MGVLHGLVAPAGEGMVVEVHLDIMEASADFLVRLKELGFEDDPFLDFSPPQYRFHYTGRTRVLSSGLHTLIEQIDEITKQVIQEANKVGVRMYVESELVRDIHHFEDDKTRRGLTAFDGLKFEMSQAASAAKADVHIEFKSGTVPDEVRDFLTKSCFYWVRTPASDRFPSEEIATLQSSSFFAAQVLYRRLVAAPLEACTGIHLEQKLAVAPSDPDLPLPDVIQVQTL